jgi:hypothetical protein
MNRTREKKMFKQNSYYLTDHGDVVDYFSLDEYIHKYKEFLTEANAELLDWELNADKDRLEITYEVERDGELEKDFEYVNYQMVTTYVTAV